MLARLPRVMAWALVLAAAGCLPIRYNARVSPPLSGVYRDTAGTPVPGVRFAVGAGEDDSDCASARVRTTTDSAGAFRLPVTRERYWIPLNADLATYPFVLCAGRADSLHAVYGSVARRFREVTLDCFEWVWEGKIRTECGPPSLAGGRWSDGAAEGWFRVIDHDERVYVQWLSGAGPGHPVRVHATAELPCERGSCILPYRGLSLRELASHVTLIEYGSNRTVRRTFELGSPGQLRELPRR